jgi:hypothetical protein
MSFKAVVSAKEEMLLLVLSGISTAYSWRLPTSAAIREYLLRTAFLQ